MSLAENLLNSLDETAYQNSRIAGIQPEEEHIVIDGSRKITVPENLKTIAVKGDKDIETVTFDCVRYWDGHDLSTFAIYINYILPTAKEETSYIPKEITKFEDTFSFDWTIGREITSIEGTLKFWVVAKLTDDEGNLIKQWSSLQNSDCTIAPGGDKIYVPEVQTDKDVISQAIAVSRDGAERAEAAAKKAEETADLDLVKLPQEWVDINEAYEAIGEDDHKLLGGVIYKDFEGNIRVFPLAPPYGIRIDEVGAEYAQSSIAMYNSNQQLLVKPATDGRHTVPLSQLLEELKKYLPTSGGTMTGKPIIKTSNPSVNLMDTADGNTTAYVQAYKGKLCFGYSAAKSLSVDKEGNVNIPKGLEFKFSNVFGGEVNSLSPVDTSNPDVNSRSPYLFCRDSENIFSKKVYAIHPQRRTIVERDENGEIKCSTPTHLLHAVNLEYLNERLANFSGGGGSGENTEAAQTAAQEAKAAAASASSSASTASTKASEAASAKTAAETAATNANASKETASKAASTAQSAATAANNSASEAKSARDEAQAIKNSLTKETWTFTLDDGTIITKVVCVDVGA